VQPWYHKEATNHTDTLLPTLHQYYNDITNPFPSSMLSSAQYNYTN
jgi:hypothetical protein